MRTPRSHPNPARRTRSLVFAALLPFAACSEAPPPDKVAPNSPPAKLDIPADAPLVMFLGDSISAGLHLPAREAFPAVVQRQLHAQGKKFRLVNAGSSGDTSAGGLRRIDWLLKQKPQIVVVELGGNDGLRGQKVPGIRANLDKIFDKITAAGATPLLLGMRIPSNYGADYADAFAKLYDDLAQARGCAYVPFFMSPIADKSEFFLPDALHPNTLGHQLLAEKVAPALATLLK